MRLEQSKVTKLWYVVNATGKKIHGGFASEAIAKSFLKG